MRFLICFINSFVSIPFQFVIKANTIRIALGFSGVFIHGFKSHLGKGIIFFFAPYFISADQMGFTVSKGINDRIVPNRNLMPY